MDQLKALPRLYSQSRQGDSRNSSGLNDGASAMIIMSAEKAKELGLKPIARIRLCRTRRLPSFRDGIKSGSAVKNLLKNDPKLTIDSFELCEVNEAFAGQYLVAKKNSA